MKPEVLLIDLSSLYWTSVHAVPKEASVSEPAALAETMIRRAVGQCEQGALVAICLDQGRSFRKDLHPEYKSNRPEKDQTILAELGKLKDRLRAAGMWLVGADGFEADDVVATLCHAAVKAEHPVCIASADKDLLQLTALADVRQLRTYNDWMTWRAADVVTKFGVEPEGFGDWLALVGDSSDNVKGVPSVGPKTATSLLVQHGGLEDIYRKIDMLGLSDEVVKKVLTTDEAKAIGTPAVVEKLWRHKADAMLARKLVELRLDAPVNFQDIYERRAPVTKTNSKTTNLDSVDDVISGPTKSAAASAVADPAPSGSSQDQSPIATTPDVPSTADLTTALVPHVHAEYEHGLEPRTAGQAVTLGEVLYESRAYSRFPTAGSITATIMRGRELGIPAMASLDAFHYAADMGRILPSWQVIVTLAEQSPDCEWFRWVEGDDMSQSWETKHRKHPTPTRLTYKIEQAARAGLLKKDKPLAAWNARPDEMLRKTAACQLARTVYPGATLGLYSVEEMGGE